MSDVRAQSGVPVLAQFTGTSTPSACAPLIVDTATGNIYSLMTGDVVVLAGAANAVVGPASVTSGNVCLFDGATGKLIKDGGTLGTAAFTASSAYDASGAATSAVSTHAALTTGVHGLAIAAGQTLTVTTGGTLGTAAYSASSAFEVANTNLGSIAALANSAGWLHNDGAATFAYSTPTAAQVGALASGGTAANSSQLEGGTWEVPGTIGSTTPNTGAFTTITESTGAAWTNYSPTISADTGTWNTPSSMRVDYRLLGKTLFIQVNITVSVASGSPNELRVSLPASKSGARGTGAQFARVINNNVAVTGWAFQTSSTYISFQLATGTWAGSCLVQGAYIIETT